jgi:hypothetical protein
MSGALGEDQARDTQYHREYDEQLPAKEDPVNTNREHIRATV